LHDEISTLQLELGQIEERNSTLSKDNAKLLQRWLDAKQAEANKMNEANQFYETMRTKHQTVLSWQDPHIDSTHTNTSLGKAVGQDSNHSMQTKDGIFYQTQNLMEQTPNG
jgi:autophagy-related protein 16-1